MAGTLSRGKSELACSDRFLNAIIRDLRKIREFLETMLVNRSSEEYCDFICRFLLQLYPSAKLQGGYNYHDGHELPEGGGFLDAAGHWQLHYWLLHEGRIMDLASDQFTGGRPVAYIPLNDPEARRYRSTEIPQQLERITKHSEVISKQWLLNWRVWQGEPLPSGRFILLQQGQPWRVFAKGTTMRDVRTSLSSGELTWSYLPELPCAARNQTSRI
jgi:hypothetical protein